MKKFVFAALVACTVSAPAFAAEARDGARVEGRLMYETPTVSSVIENDDIFKIGSAVAFGGEIGYDFKVSNSVVVGPYVNFEKSTVESSDGEDTIKVRDNFAAGLHLGVALTDSSQLYVKAGYAKLRLQGQFGLPGDPESFFIRDSGEGVQGAIGYEQGFGKNLYGRVEFGYADNGKALGVNVQRRHAGVSLGARF
jgi:outer membrane immunogenic protein